MQQLIKNIEQWAEDRNLINGSTPQKQMLKLMEEFGELCGGIARNNPEMIKDAIGDLIVVCIIKAKQEKGKYSRFFGILHHLALINRFTLNDCLAHAYDQIKDRKGEMQAGIWVKEDDL
ncbi:MazG-like family protein [Mannheimia haemolytica]|nr:MazG-like family protein [Mannheimia haemolytica]